MTFNLFQLNQSNQYHNIIIKDLKDCVILYYDQINNKIKGSNYKKPKNRKFSTILEVLIKILVGAYQSFPFFTKVQKYFHKVLCLLTCFESGVLFPYKYCIYFYCINSIKINFVVHKRFNDFPIKLIKIFLWGQGQG